MASVGSQPTAGRPAIDQGAFRQVLSRPAVAREFFLPADQAWWDGGRYTLGRWAAKATRPKLAGVRLQEPQPSSAGPPPEKDTQQDLSSLIRSVAELRKVPELSGVVLSDETLVGKQTGTIPGKRVVFGLRCPADGRFKGEAAAAQECHRVLRRAVNKAGYEVEHPKAPFRSTGGLTGLVEWAATVRLRRRKNRRWLMLLVLPLLLMPLSCVGCMLFNPFSLLGLPTDQEGLLKSLDPTGNMQKLQDEMKKIDAMVPGANPQGNKKDQGNPVPPQPEPEAPNGGKEKQGPASTLPP